MTGMPTHRSTLMSRNNHFEHGLYVYIASSTNFVDVSVHGGHVAANLSESDLNA